MRARGSAAISILFALATSCASTPKANAPSSSASASASPPVALAHPPPRPPEDHDDDDHDGILDRDDKCPDQPEDYDGHEDEDGCPDVPGCALPPKKIVLLDRIEFAKGSSKIEKDGLETVDAVAKVMIENSEIMLVEIEGFADDDPSVTKSVALSTARARAVLDALVAHGAPKERLRAKGYGPYCRIEGAPAEKNRRVELRIAKVAASMELDSKELGCADASAHGIAPDPLP